MKKIIIIVLAFFITVSAKAQLFLKITLTQNEAGVAQVAINGLPDGIHKTMLNKKIVNADTSYTKGGVKVKEYIMEFPQLQALYAGVSKLQNVAGKEELLEKLKSEIKKQVGQ